jgi:hypothetical protein
MAKAAAASWLFHSGVSPDAPLLRERWTHAAEHYSPTAMY